MTKIHNSKKTLEGVMGDAIRFIRRWGARKKMPDREGGRRYDCQENVQGWGHSCNVGTPWYKNDKLQANCNGNLSPMVSVGDEVILSMQSGKPAVWKFIEVRNCDNPKDMFFATIECIDYLEKLETKEVSHEHSETAKIALEGRTPETHPKQFRRR